MIYRNGVRAALAAALCVLVCAAPVAAETTATTTTTAAAATTTTTAATTTTTTATTTTTVVTTTTTVAATTTTTTAAAAVTTATAKPTTAATATAKPTAKPTEKPTAKPTAKPAAKPLDKPVATTTQAGGATTTTQADGASLPEAVVLVDEPETETDGVYYYADGKKVQPHTFGWMAGHTGKALSLDGQNQYLRLASAKALALEEFTLSAWVKLRVDKVGANLLTVYKNESRFLAVSPHVQDAERGINGWYMEWQDREGEPVTAFVPAAAGTTLAPAVGQWLHVAVVVSDTEFSLYLDGVRYLTKPVETDYDEIGLSQFVVGGGFYGEPLLDGLLDDVALYPTALGAKQVAALAGNAVQSDRYYPTRPLADMDRGVVGTTAARPTVFGLPLVPVVLVGGVLVTVLVLSLVLSAQRKRQSTEEEHL